MNTVKKVVSLILAVVLIVNGPVMLYASSTLKYNDASLTADKNSWSKWKDCWDFVADNYENVAITVGAHEDELGFAFFQHCPSTPKVRIAAYSASTTDVDKLMANATVFTGTYEKTKVALTKTLKNYLYSIGQRNQCAYYYSSKVNVSGLKAYTKYYYQVYQNGTWGEVKTYKTYSFNEYSFMYVADPQIGASAGQRTSESTSAMTEYEASRNDTYNWNDIITKGIKKNSSISFIISAGDQVNRDSYEYEYAGFLNPSILSGYSMATAIGNHDAKGYNYSWHFNNPNSFDTNGSDTTYTEGHSKAGSDYYFRYGSVLYVVFDTNNTNCTTHENVLKKAISENEDAKWRIVVVHHDIYGSSGHAETDGKTLRTQLTPMMDMYDVDVVLQGHSHAYNRTYQINSDCKKHAKFNSLTAYKDNAKEYEAENQCYKLVSMKKQGNYITNPKGTVYFEQSSATGSKYYGLVSKDRDYISECVRNNVPAYAIVKVRNNSLTFTFYNGQTGEQLENTSTYTIFKNDKAVRDTYELKEEVESTEIESTEIKSTEVESTEVESTEIEST